jgi:actin related protein 2/3 complex subunit 1A/1B
VNAFIKGVDKKAPNPNLGGNLPFGEIFAEFDQSLGWVQTVRFSPSGNTLVFCGQDSTVNFVDVPSGQVQTIKTRDLPFADTLFMSEDSVVCVGHDFTPVLFQKKGDWKMIRKLDQGGDSAAKGPAKNAAFEKFKSQVDYGVDQSESKLSTKHQNCITYICPFKRSGPNVSQYSTSGLDGQLAVWDARF